MRYTLTITRDDTASIWPALEEFNNREYKRRDHAKYALECAVYEAVKGRALLDRPAGRKAQVWAANVEIKPDSCLEYVFVGLTFRMQSSK
jgi:hypothetical protein